MSLMYQSFAASPPAQVLQVAVVAVGTRKVRDNAQSGWMGLFGGRTVRWSFVTGCADGRERLMAALALADVTLERLENICLEAR